MPLAYKHIPPRSRPSREFGARRYPNDYREQPGQSVSLLFTHFVKLSEYMHLL